MFPYKLCGLYILAGCNNPEYIGSELSIDYNHITFSALKKVGPVRIYKKIYGSIFVKENAVKIMWLNSGKYEIDMGIPLITYPYVNNQCKRMNCEYTSDTDNWITIYHNKEQYVFRKVLYPESTKSSLISLFFTQLLLDLIIRHIG
jgi:hypothetical protein